MWRILHTTFTIINHHPAAGSENSSAGAKTGSCLTAAARRLYPEETATALAVPDGHEILIMPSATDLPAGFTPERRYYAFSRFLSQRFGGRTYRVTIDAGFTCPNVDGTVTTGGCVYCDNRSFSPNRRLPRTSVRAQVARGVELLGRRYRAGR